MDNKINWLEEIKNHRKLGLEDWSNADDAFCYDMRITDMLRTYVVCVVSKDGVIVATLCFAAIYTRVLKGFGSCKFEKKGTNGTVVTYSTDASLRDRGLL